MENVMNIFLSHIDFMPIVYGLVMFIGISILFNKLVTGRFLSLAIDIAVFWFVFALHGGSMTGGFSAMIAALLAGITFPWMLRRAFK
jgi:hypothetical protein